MKPQDRTRAILQSGLPRDQQWLLIAIADRMGAADVTCATLKTVARETGAPLSSLYRHDAAIEKAGLVSRMRDGTFKNADSVRINWPALVAMGAARKIPKMGKPEQATDATADSQNGKVGFPEWESEIPGMGTDIPKMGTEVGARLPDSVPSSKGIAVDFSGKATTVATICSDHLVATTPDPSPTPPTNPTPTTGEGDSQQETEWTSPDATTPPKPVTASDGLKTSGRAPSSPALPERRVDPPNSPIASPSRWPDAPAGPPALKMAGCASTVMDGPTSHLGGPTPGLHATIPTSPKAVTPSSATTSSATATEPGIHGLSPTSPETADRTPTTNPRTTLGPSRMTGSALTAPDARSPHNPPQAPKPSEPAPPTLGMEKVHGPRQDTEESPSHPQRAPGVQEPRLPDLWAGGHHHSLPVPEVQKRQDRSRGREVSEPAPTPARMEPRGAEVRAGLSLSTAANGSGHFKDHRAAA